jgi:hypothetical protein
VNTLSEGDNRFGSASRRLELFLWSLILFLATALRAAPIPARLPYLAYIDEGHVLHVVERFLVAGGWDTRNYVYPALPSYLIATLLHLVRGISVITGHPIWSRATLIDYHDGTDLYDLVTPAVIVTGRVVICIVSVITVWLTGLLARRIAGPRAGVMAGLFAALCPALALRGSIVIVDTVAALPALLTLLVAHRFQTAESGRAAGLVFIGGLTSGLAFDSKYTIGAVFLSVVVAIALPEEAPARKLSLFAFAGLGLAVGAVVGMPAVIVRHRTILNVLRWDRTIYGALLSEPGYWGQASLPEELGWPLLLAGGTGLLALTLRRGTRPIALGWLAFVSCLLLVLVPHTFQPFRNLVPVVPVWCVCAAVLLSGAVTPGHRWIDALGVFVAAAVAMSLLPGLRAGIADRIMRPDTRAQLVEWLARHTSGGDRVLVVQELAIARGELDRVPAMVRVVPWQHAVDVARSDRPRFVVGGSMDLTDADRPVWEEPERKWKAWMASETTVAAFGRRPTRVAPNFWRDNDELLFVLQPGAQPTVTRAKPGLAP